MAKQSWFSMRAAGQVDDDWKVADISILNEIGGFGVSQQDFHDSLMALGKRDELRISISSDGGDVTVGFMIYNILRRHSARKVIRIEGLAASMASVIAMAGDEVIMPSNAMIMIHNPWGQVTGEGDQVVSFGEALNKMRLNIAQSYVERTGARRRDILSMMDKETWLTAQEAVQKGFADRVEKPLKAAAQLSRMNFKKFNNVPDSLKSLGRNANGVNMGTKQNKGRAAFEEDESETGDAKSTSEIRAELLATQEEIRNLVKLSGRKPEVAEGFIKADKSVSEVIKALGTMADDDAKAKAEADKKNGKRGSGKSNVRGSDDTELSNHSGNERNDSPATELDSTAIFAKFNSAGKSAR